MENKAIVTCNGDQALISKLYPLIKQGLPREVVEWKRSFGRPVRSIRIDANFVPYKSELVPREDNWVLLGRAFFHIFWTECDIDNYKAHIKDEISEWLAFLKSRNVTDWLIVVIVNDESKVKTKILRTSVLDKIKNDFCSKNMDRCVVLQEPFKPDSKSSECWSKLFTSTRQLILQSFNSNLNRFEEHMRLQREKRQEANWTFNSYFLLQEELAFMFEMLGLYEDALVQYDELDALFTQFVLNHAAGDVADWLQRYTDTVPTRWDSMQLSKPIDFSKRTLLRKCEDSLLDFRNYLALRQATLLFLLQKPWQVAERAIPFMHNCLHELKLLEIKLPEGGSACWVFLTCLEVVKTCESYIASGKMVETYSLHMAVLWDFARKKLYELASCCGLLPCSEKENLSLVVDLIAGFTLSEDTESLIKLRESLSSKESFTKHFLELSELAMGTYKHIGRMRFAKLICKDLAEFYRKTGNYQKAESFLQDALKIYVQDGWPKLTDQIRLELADCQKRLNFTEKYIRTITHLVASSTLQNKERTYFQEELIQISNNFEGPSINIPTKPLLLITSIATEKSKFIVTEESVVNIVVYLFATKPIQFSKIEIALAYNGTSEETSSNGYSSASTTHITSVSANASNISVTSFGSLGSQTSAASLDVLSSANVGNKEINKVPPSIDISEHCEYTSNNQVVLTSSLKSKTVLKRLDSGQKMVVIDKEIEEGDYTVCLKAVNDEGQDAEMLKPGENIIGVKAELIERGVYTVTQVKFCLNNVQFLRNVPVEEVQFRVSRPEPQLHFTLTNDEMLYSGVDEELVVDMSAGSEHIHEHTQLYFTYDTHILSIVNTKLKNRCLDLMPLEAFESRQIRLSIKAHFFSQQSDTLHSRLQLEWKPFNKVVEKNIQVFQPFQINHKLHTAGKKKFVQCTMQCVEKLSFSVINPHLSCECLDVELISLNKHDKRMTVNGQQSVSYIWEVRTNVLGVDLTLPCLFTVTIDNHTHPSSDSENQQYQYKFTLENYQTLYSIESSVLLPEFEKNFFKNKSYEFTFKVKSLQSGEKMKLLYMVTSPNKEWEIKEQTQGMVELDDKDFSQSIHLVPLNCGFVAHPLVQLFHVKEGWSKAIVSNTAQQVLLDIDDLCDQKILVALPAARVYNASAAQTLCVQPPLTENTVNTILSPSISRSS